MKKFLSLVLALIMAMSLVTISAGATEYKDLTDKEEIQYEEAVAVLNRIGVITGYEDGSFRPETELTRGAAAKIIVSLMIGPDAASALPNNQSPYPDVPAGHTFAGVIGYCKTAGYISGYGDGTFKPANPLTGYAFAKMLLGAVGYKANIEGFVDTGWTMNVARIGNVAGLFDRISFDGAKAVTRDEACQLALNTLKATMVDYGGTNTVISSSGEVLTVQGSKAQYVTSNNRDINANINRRVINATNNEMTLEFGEEHFKDLRLEHDKYDPAFDVYGHPSNEWSYKKVTIGTFPLPADFTYTKQMAHLEDTDASKEKALGLRGYDTWSIDHRANVGNWSTAGNSANLYMNSPFDDVTQIIINGWDARVNEDGDPYTWHADAAQYNNLKSAPADAPTIAEICDLTDNGVTVEVYVCPVDADFITHVVVTRTQLMEVRRVASDYVSLDQVDSDSKDETLVEITGYNDNALDDANDGNIVDVKDNNFDAYNVLKELKAGDKVAVVPYTTDDGVTWEVGEAYVPETVSGALTKSTGYATSKKADGNAITVTVGGTEYPIAQWNKDLRDIDANLIKATKKDVTLLLDKMGNALLAKDTGNADDWMVICDYYQAPASNGGKVVWWAHGKSLDGKDDIDVNLGTIRGDAEFYAPGEIVHYDIASGGTGEYELTRFAKDSAEGVYEIARYYEDSTGAIRHYNITSKNQLVPLVGCNITDNVYGTKTIAEGPCAEPDVNDTCGTVKEFTYQPGIYTSAKFIFVDFDKNGEVETFIVKDGPVDVDWDDLGVMNTKWKNVGTNPNGVTVNAKGEPVGLRAEAYISKKGEVKAVVIKTDAGDADLSNIILTTDTTRDEEVDADGVKWHGRKITRGSDSFKNEDTVLLDKFTEVGEFSRIVKETEEDGTKKIEVKGIGGEFENRAVEPIQVYGIDYARNANGSKNDKVGFRVGQSLGYTVEDLNGNNLVKPAGKAVKNIEADFMGRDDIMGDSVLDMTNIEGLIRVNSSTKILDLRQIQDDRIDTLKELVDHEKYDLSKVKLSILFNADKGSDGFRYAYLIAVIEAPVRLPYPIVTISGNNGETGTEYTVAKRTSLTLTPTCTAMSDKTAVATNDVTYTWRDADGKTVTMPLANATAGEFKYTLTVSPKSSKYSDTKITVTVNVTETEGMANGSVDTTALTEADGKFNTEKTYVKSDLGTGNTRLYLGLTAPDWAYTGNDAASTDLGTVKYTVTVDGKDYNQTAKLQKSTASDGVKATAANGATFEGFVAVTTTDVWAEGALSASTVKGKAVTVKITDVEWNNAKVNYVYAAVGEADPVAITTGISAETKYLELAKASALTFTYTKPAELTGSTIKYSVTGATTDPETAAAGSVNSGSPVNIAKATPAGDVAVVVTIEGVTAPEPAVERTVKSSLGTLEFTKAAAGTATPAADAEWGTTVSATAGEVVFMRASGALATLKTDSTGLGAITAIDTDDTTAVSLSPSQAVPGIAMFNMVNKNLTIVGATVNAPEVKAFTIAEDGSELNVLLKSSYTFDDDNQELQFVADYLNSQDGYTVTVNKGVSGTDILSLTVNGVTVAPTNVNTAHNLLTAYVDGDLYVTKASSGSDVDVLKLAGVTTKSNLYIRKTANGAGSSSAIDYNGTTNAGALADKDAFDTNLGAGYIKLQATPVTAAAVVTGAGNALGATTVAAALKAGDDWFTDTNAYVKAGATLTITLTPSTSTTLSGYDLKAAIALGTGSDAALGGDYTSATVVPTLVDGTVWSAATEITFTVSNPTVAAVSAITVTLTEAAT